MVPKLCGWSGAHAALAEEDRCLNKNRALYSSCEPNNLQEGEESSSRKRSRDMYPESDESEIIVSHQPNLTHTNPIFQSSETMPLVSSEMNHPDFIRSTANQIVEDDVEMRDRAIDTHVLGKLNNGAQEGSANMVLALEPKGAES